MKFISAFLLTCITISSVANATTHQEKEWGLGVTIRQAETPFVAQESKVSSFVPQIYYNGETFYMDGIEGGAHLYQHDDWQINLLGRMRFLDIPEEYSEIALGDHVDAGIQWRKKYAEDNQFDVEIFSDVDGRFYGSLANNWFIKTDNWEISPSVRVRFKSADFNSQYFALNEFTDEKIGAGIDASGKLEAKYHVASNLYLLGTFAVSALDNNAYHSQAVDKRWSSEAYLGFGFFNNNKVKPKSQLKNKAYLRVAHGWATPSNIGEIFAGDTVKDPYNNQLTSFVYGIPLTDEFFSIPFDIYLTPGFVWHWDSEVQNSTQEVVLAAKAFYTITWPVKWRIGLAEGLSYTSKLTYIEQTEMDEKGYEGSKLMNYIDMSLDINIGDLFNNHQLNDIWLGYSLHHRSAIFGQSSQFGRLKGGSNYNTVYLQFDF